MGVPDPPGDIGSAVDAYEAAKARQERRLGVKVQPELGREVRSALGTV
jgi:hypothetical protein